MTGPKTVATDLKLDGKMKLVPGRVFRVKGERGTFRFTDVRQGQGGGHWIDAYDRDGTVRSFSPLRVRKVYRTVCASRQEHRAQYRT